MAPYLLTTASGKVKLTGEYFSGYRSDDPIAKPELPSSQRYKEGNILAVIPMNSDDIINNDDEDGHWADPGGWSDAQRCPGEDKHTDDSEGEKRQTGR
jgi:hypothetical protein